MFDNLAWHEGGNTIFIPWLFRLFLSFLFVFGSILYRCPPVHSWLSSPAKTCAENKNICQRCFYNSKKDNGNVFIPSCPMGLCTTLLHCPRRRSSLARGSALQAASQSVLFRLGLITVSLPNDLSSSQRPEADIREGIWKSLAGVVSPSPECQLGFTLWFSVTT